MTCQICGKPIPPDRMFCRWHPPREKYSELEIEIAIRLQASRIGETNPARELERYRADPSKLWLSISPADGRLLGHLRN